MSRVKQVVQSRVVNGFCHGFTQGPKTECFSFHGSWDISRSLVLLHRERERKPGSVDTCWHSFCKAA